MHTSRRIIRKPAPSPVRKKFIIEARHFRLALGRRTRIMGILNLTPDSFSGDGTFLKYGNDPRKNVSLAVRLLREGADIIDVGGESTRPGAHPVSASEEINRVIPTIRLLAKKTKIPISIDTYKETVAQYALDNGASIVNNILGTNVAADFLKMVKRYHAALVLMHIRGTPQTMQKNIRYKNPTGEIIRELRNSIEKCLEVGINSDKIIIDPGIGFAKTVRHNLEIIRRLEDFKTLDKPLLIGVSRKSFIGKILKKEAGERLWGTAAAVSASILGGAHIVRVHDVKAMREVSAMSDAILNMS